MTSDRTWTTINNWCDKGVGGVYSKGVHWFNRKFLPTIERASKSITLPEHRYLISDAYYLQGDIHDFNAAPLAAIKAYKKSIEFDHNNASSWRELGGMYGSIGQGHKAIACLHKAIALDPEDEYAKMDIKPFEENVDTTLFYEGDIYWQAREYLAQKNYQAFDRIIAPKRGVMKYLYKCLSLGAQNKEYEYVESLRRIQKYKKEIKLEWYNWFYQPSNIEDNIEYWQIMINIFPRLISGVSISHDSLTNNYFSTFKIREGKDNRMSPEYVKIIFQFNLYRCQKNMKKLQELSRKL